MNRRPLRSQRRSSRPLTALMLGLVFLIGGSVLALADGLEIGPVPGLTTAWHEAPSVTSVPLGVEIELRIAAAPGERVQWLGAKALSSSGSHARALVQLDAAGPHPVRVSFAGPRGSQRVAQMLLQGEALVPRIETVRAMEGIVLDPVKLAALSPLVRTGANAYRTSVDRPITLEARVTPSGYAPLVEWRLPGEETHLGTSLDVSFAEAGSHDLEVGPLAVPHRLQVETYRVRLISDWNGDLAEEALFLAETVPAGFESELRWVASVEGTDRQATGNGASFAPRLASLDEDGSRLTIVSTVVVGPMGVTIVAIRPILKKNCGKTTKLAVRDGAGRPASDPAGTPNGFLQLGTTQVSTGGVSCISLTFDGRRGDVWLPALGEGLLRNGGSTTTTYSVGGNNLQEAGNNIFDPNSGQGFQEPGGSDRYAGQAELEFSYEWTGTDNGNGSVTVQIGDIDWETEVKVPDWEGKDGASQGQQDEWDRFSEKLAEHEQGHVDINDEGMGEVEEELSGKPAGKIQVEASKIPEYDKEGNPKTPEDQAAHDAINEAIGNAIEGSQGYQDMETNHTNYDAPQSQSNPGGTDHGATQGAVLDTGVQ